MPYYTGSVGSFEALHAALLTACAANDWTLSGEGLAKGDVYIELLTELTWFRIRGRAGQFGELAPTGARIGPVTSGHNVTFPATYHIHVCSDPDEVYLLINYGAQFWQWMAFGHSDVAGAPGTGVWFGASVGLNPGGSVQIGPSGGGSVNNAWVCPALFFNVSGQANAGIHTGMDAVPWSGPSGGGIGGASASLPAEPRYARQPSAWNAGSVLLPMQVYVRRPDNKQSLVADLAHARLVRIDNHMPGDVVGAAPDLFRAYPWFRRDTSARDGGSGIMHSGTLGWAIRAEVG